MLPITNSFIRINSYSRPGIALKSIKGIVMHYTASPGAPAKNIVKYFDSLAEKKTYASAHYSVDNLSIVQAIPDKEMAYHCGSTTYTDAALIRLGVYPNNCTIGIEMCLDKAGNITEKTFQNCVDLVAYLLKKYGLTVDEIWTHKGIVGWKECPLPWVKNPSEFDRFKREVSLKLQPPFPKTEKKEEEYLMKPEDANKIIETWIGPAWNFSQSEVDKKELNRLANELRKASGQKTT